MASSSIPSFFRVFILVLVVGTLWCGAGPGCVPTDNLGNDLINGGDQNNTDNSGKPADNSNDSGDQGQALPGDMNGDGALNLADRDAFVAAYQVAFGSSFGDPTYDAKVDMDKNGIVDFRDLQLFDVVVPEAIQ